MSKVCGWMRTGGILLALVPACTGLARAQAPAAAATAAAAAPKAACDPGKALVTDVYKEVPQRTVTTPGKAASVQVGKVRTVKLGDILTIEVDGLRNLQPDCLNPAGTAGKAGEVVLYIDDRPLTDVRAFPPTDPSGKVLRFPLRRTEASRDVWTYVLGRPGWAPRETKFSVGLSDKYALPVASTAPPVLLDVIPQGWFLFWLLLFLILLIGFYQLARRTDLLRDPAPLPGGDARRPYSLARTQASWWFFLILASYLLIGMITGDFSSSITSTCLILMGISAGTAVGSAFIDASKDTPETARLQAATKQKLSNDVQRLSSDVPTAESVVTQNPNDPTAEAALASKQVELANKLSQLHKARNESESFLQDILSDANGVNFHRFQMLAWTIVLGIIFVGNVYRDLAMPDFNSTLLSLMGISAGTYLGLKIPEDTVPKTDPPIKTDPAPKTDS